MRYPLNEARRRKWWRDYYWKRRALGACAFGGCKRLALPNQVRCATHKAKNRVVLRMYAIRKLKEAIGSALPVAEVARLLCLGSSFKITTPGAYRYAVQVYREHRIAARRANAPLLEARLGECRAALKIHHCMARLKQQIALAKTCPTCQGGKAASAVQCAFCTRNRPLAGVAMSQSKIPGRTKDAAKSGAQRNAACLPRTRRLLLGA